ncbi:MAG: prepilin-type N-terminal cleavage/methylation domain-containing protein [Proteobacteria bacterium]|nr:prepilin-type N-terminal cleavage/methylation domain-containing protein [Pseudomonadota bacterium]MCP4917687.1 prepilin-type N-terminal cleavage/methylation domain-containing protein [Pseudomonadota bacterium]
MFSSRQAFTLVELLFVLVLISVIVAIGIGSAQDLLPRFRMVKVGKDLRQDVAQLRVTAAETGRETRLLLVESDSSWDDAGTPNKGRWLLQVGNKSRASTSWDTLPIDATEDGVDNSSALGTVDLSASGTDDTADVSLVPWSGITDDAIVFSPRGFVSNRDGDFVGDGYIQLSIINKAALVDDVEDAVTLNIARSGNVTLTSALGHRDAGSVGSSANSEVN